tara:strand:- start:98 stop:340 length:243 start_codon:yes stop_codon:yes gene_type:complete
MNIKKVTQEVNPNYTKGGFYKKVLGYKVETDSSTYFIQNSLEGFQLYQATSFEDTCSGDDNHLMNLSTKADCLWTIENQF